MDKLNKYFKKELQKEMFYLDHGNISDFYVSSCQRSNSAVPLLCVRTFVFISCVAILLSSTILTGNSMSFAFWPIFLTHWGLVLITVFSGFAFFVSLRIQFGGHIDVIFTLPWYVKAYWCLYEITIPIAFFISAFYYALLTQTDEEFSIDPVLDVFIHGINSVLMLMLLVFSRHPSRLLHFVYPLAPTIVYLIFSIIYYFSGGTNPFGDGYIYPMLDWSDPGQAMVTVVLSAAMLIFMHVIVVIISILRNAFTKRYFGDNHTLNISDDPYN